MMDHRNPVISRHLNHTLHLFENIENTQQQKYGWKNELEILLTATQQNHSDLSSIHSVQADRHSLFHSSVFRCHSAMATFTDYVS